MSDPILWEMVPNSADNNFPVRTLRAKVPGGWLVAVVPESGAIRASGLAVTFYPDGDYKWGKDAGGGAGQ